MAELNVVDTGAGGAVGLIQTPYLQTLIPGYSFGMGNGYMEFGSGTPGSLPFRVDQNGNVTASSVNALTGLKPSGDTTGVTDTANVQGLLSLTNVADLGYGMFYLDSAIVLQSGQAIRGVKGSSASGDDSGTNTVPPVGTVLSPVAGWTTALNTSGVITLANNSGGIHVTDIWIWGPHGPAALDGICTNGATGSNAVYLQNVGIAWMTGNGIADYAGNGWHVVTCYAGNCLGHGVVAASADGTWINVHAQSCGQSGTVGDGFYNIGANSRLIGCRADLSQNGFTVNGADGTGYLDAVQLIGCSTQRNNFNGLNIINSSAAGNALRDPVIVDGCNFFGDGQNGTNSTSGITGGIGGGGYAGITVAGKNTLIATGTNVIVGTVDVAGGCPQYAVATATSGTGPTAPTLLTINGGILNGVTAYLNDAAAVGAGIRISTITEQSTAAQFYTNPNYPVQVAENLGAQQDQFTQPTGCLAATMPRNVVANACSALTSGVLYLRAIGIQAGVLCTNLTFVTNTAAKTGGTHGWYVLLDNNYKVLAVTADQTDPATVWGTASTAYPLAFGTAYRTTRSGLYYVGVMVAESAGTMPTFSGSTTSVAAGINGITPVLAGSSSTVQTTPPAIGATMQTIGGNAGYNFYAYVT